MAQSRLRGLGMPQNRSELRGSRLNTASKRGAPPLISTSLAPHLAVDPAICNGVPDTGAILGVDPTPITDAGPEPEKFLIAGARARPRRDNNCMTRTSESPCWRD